MFVSGWRGKLVLLLDLDEHTGQFSGVRQYFQEADLPSPEGVYIGYPGNDRIVVGSRGFARARVTVLGRAAHSGASGTRGVNAVVRAAQLASSLDRLELPRARSTDPFNLPPQLTVTVTTGRL